MLEVIKTPCAIAISPENLKLVWQTPLLGMLMIFAVLSLLWGVLAIFRVIFDKTPKEKKQPKAEKPAPAPAAKPEAAPAAPVAQSNDDAQLVAVITAAVAAYMQSEGNPAPDGNFRVVSFKRVSGRAWNSK